MKIKEDRFDWKPSRSAARNASSQLPGLVANFFKGGRRALRQSKVESVHRFRIEAKRFRYTLELFRSCYGPALERRLESLKELQGYLGEINDLATIGQLVNDPAIREHLDRRLLSKRAEFRRHWRESFDRPGEEAAWTRYLGRPMPT